MGDVNVGEILEATTDAQVEDYVDRVRGMDYYDNGIFFSEGFAFCRLCDHFKVNVILESGTCYGSSTEIFARYFEGRGIRIRTVDLAQRDFVRQRLSRFGDVELIDGDSFKEIPRLLQEMEREGERGGGSGGDLD